jgi:hypothetical protein
MREWIMVIAPVAVVLYFLIFPGQLPLLFDWLNSTGSWITASI